MRLLPLDPRPGRVIRCLRFAADGRFLAAVSGRPDDPRRRPVLFDLATSTAAPAPPAKTGRVGDPVFAPDPRLTAELLDRPDGDTVLRLTDARGGRPEERQLAPFWLEGFTAAGFSADGGTLFVGRAVQFSQDPGITVVRLDVGNWLDRGDPDRIDDLLPTDDPDLATGFADTGAGVLAVGTAGGRAVLFDLIAGETLLTVEHAPAATDPPPVDAVLFSPDGRHLVTRSAGSLAVWDALTGRELARPRAARPLADAAFTPDGRSLLAAGADGGVYRFDAPRYGMAGRLDFGTGPLHSVAVAPDGLVAAAGTAAGTAVLWDV